ncbi:minor capsid protein [Kitasatospora viridis]|uniref:HK97 gp10 family phage protein n=1 Tax=Kitasatospora viridis TaxID=281105 RepID=A0A561UKM5_9ACTN|nr:minor capsid protein [Kitasatospora viridis]TWF99912.1 hypothetical protein FHX73_113772 [Kitasatospora viridis]
MTLGTTFRWDGDRWLAAAREAAARGLELGLEHVLTQANQLVPLEEGTLERSGKVSMDTANLTGAVSYDTVYAVRQHEELSWKHAPGRQAKYLEQPFNSESAVVLEMIAAQIRRTGAEGNLQ